MKIKFSYRPLRERQRDRGGGGGGGVGNVQIVGG